MNSWVIFADWVTVWTIEREPFSYKVDWEWTWFSIELWREIAEGTNLDYSFNEYTDFSEMIQDTNKMKNDISVANISITAEREKILNFSSPIYDSGLNILELSQNSEVLWFYNTYSKKLSLILCWFAWILFLMTHYFFVSNVLKGYVTWLSYPKEIFIVFFELLVQIKEMFGMKLLLPLSGLVAIFLVAFISQKFTLILNDIDEDKLLNSKTISYKDIVWKKVGVTDGSVGQEYLKNREILSQWYTSLPQLYKALESKELDYVVFDEPILRYKVKNDPIFRVSWKTFNKDQYAMLFPQYEDKHNADFIKKVNVAILEMKENGRYDEIYKEYFD